MCPACLNSEGKVPRGGGGAGPWLRGRRGPLWKCGLCTCSRPVLLASPPPSATALPAPQPSWGHLQISHLHLRERDFTPSTCRSTAPRPRPLPLLPVLTGRSPGRGSGAPGGVCWLSTVRKRLPEGRSQSWCRAGGRSRSLSHSRALRSGQGSWPPGGCPALVPSPSRSLRIPT